jgi:hypothetical protein
MQRQPPSKAPFPLNRPKDPKEVIHLQDRECHRDKVKALVQIHLKPHEEKAKSLCAFHSLPHGRQTAMLKTCFLKGLRRTRRGLN